jgi:hypothetical protein
MDPSVNLNALAEMTKNFSGAEIEGKQSLLLSLVSSCCCTIVSLVTLLSHCCYTVVTLYCHTADKPWVQCKFERIVISS